LDKVLYLLSYGDCIRNYERGKGVGWMTRDDETVAEFI